MFDAVYCINHATAHHRWERIQAQLQSMPFGDNLIRFEAIYPPEDYHPSRLIRGRAGCLMSHQGAYKEGTFP